MDPELADQFAAMGVDVAVADAPVSEEVVEVMPANWNSLCVWLACQNQWRTVVRGTAIVLLGLDMNAVDVVMRRLKAADEVIEDLLVMETAALNVLHGAS
ncbi:DUF1799 domain-containing protein [Salipiger marinus]|uniref:DUF1799 domain-containing protein n=1 Tax=Salipiger marinus TaxID=555512 RepID=UPI002BDCD9FB|nr:DUF1799 domain-containing protein [Salipiger manganoxidans]MEB3417550.1 DUF1799 domain-containing protein [Salipiger manganoxidans]